MAEVKPCYRQRACTRHNNGCHQTQLNSAGPAKVDVNMSTWYSLKSRAVVHSRHRACGWGAGRVLDLDSRRAEVDEDVGHLLVMPAGHKEDAGGLVW